MGDVQYRMRSQYGHHLMAAESDEEAIEEAKASLTSQFPNKWVAVDRIETTEILPRTSRDPSL